jgi:hypothetical protein
MVAEGKINTARSFEQDVTDVLNGKINAVSFEFSTDKSYEYESGDFADRFNNSSLIVDDNRMGTVYVGKTQKDIDNLKKADNSIEYGRAYGYSENDIAHFYAQRRGGNNEYGFEE